jgi:hypothetical protein
MRQSAADWEHAFEHELALDRLRRDQLRERAVARSQARRMTRTAKRGNVGFGVLLVCLVATVIVVTIAMFETLAFFMGPQ